MIADELGINQSTVETYREQIKEKLGLANAAELARDAAIGATSILSDHVWTIKELIEKAANG